MIGVGIKFHTFGLDEGRSDTEISTATRFMASTTNEWKNEWGIFSMDVKQAFGNATPPNLSETMKELGLKPF